MRGRGRSLRLAWFTQFQHKFQDNQKYIERLISKKAKQNNISLTGKPSIMYPKGRRKLSPAQYLKCPNSGKGV